MNFDQFGHDIIASLENGIAKNTLLEELLINEKAALEANQMDQLKSLIEQKTQTLDDIDHLNRARASLFETVRLSYDNTGLSQLSQHLPTDQFEHIRGLWDDMHNSLTHCKTLNEVNGRIIHHTQKRNAKIMNLLRGNQDAGTYNQSGLAGKSDQHGTLAKI